MRLSSAFLFAVFALLASASPIDDHSRRSNSLSRRCMGGGHCDPAEQPPRYTIRYPIEYRHDGTVIRDVSSTESYVTFPGQPSIKFIRPDGGTAPVAFFQDSDYSDKIACRDYYRNSELEATLLTRRRDGYGMIFHPLLKDTRYGTLDIHGADGTNSHYFYRDGKLAALYEARSISGAAPEGVFWRSHVKIEWQKPDIIS